MKFNKRKTKLLSELMKSSSYLTGEHLATVLGVSTRTVRNDVKELNDCFLDMNFQIEGISGKGYKISNITKDKILKYVDFNKAYKIPILPESRVDYIIKQLLLNPKGIIVSQISEKLYISESTLYRDMNIVIQWFNDKNAQIIKCKSNTYLIDGNEQSIRKIYNNYFSNLDVTKITDSISNQLFDKLLIKTANYFINLLNTKNIKLSGDEFNVLVIDVSVIIFRSIHGFELKKTKQRDYDRDIFSIENLENLNEIKYLNSCDKAYIINLANSLILHCNNGEKNERSLAIVKSILTDISQTFTFTFSTKLQEDLCEVLSRSVEVNPSEYSLLTIKKEYPLAFEIAMVFANKVQNDSKISLPESKLLDIVFLFAINIESEMLKIEKKKRYVAIVCNAKKYHTTLLESRIKRYFPAFEIIGFYAPYRLHELLKLKPEFIISTTNLSIDSIPVVVIDPMFKDYDVIKINAFINQIENQDSKTYDFINLFKEDLFIKDIDANNQYEVINILFKTLKQSHSADDMFLQDVFDRESISSTYIGNMVAIPHAIATNVGENVVAIGITKKPITWQKNKVQLVFLINIQNASEGKVKQIFNSFFEVINSKKKVERLIKSKNYYEFIKTINR